MIDRRRVQALVRKDWRELSRNSQAVAPLLVVPLMFAVILPAAVLLLGSNPALLSGVTGLQAFADNFPAALGPDGLSPEQSVIYAVVVYFFAPFFLLIPVLISSVVASSSIVGEKERRTIEGLLYTPVTDRELILGKVLASAIPAVGLTWISFVIYTILVNALGARTFAGLLPAVFFPTPTWIVLVLLLTPLVAFLSTALVVSVSERSTTMQGAQGWSMIIVLPVIGLVVGQATGLLLLDLPVALIAAAVLAVACAGVFLLIAGRIERERIVTRL